ncbi:helix-turn-helix domain-containing protein [Alteribacillus iranensis]|uniref:Uncharacterized protein YpbB n=1 Tax=Alteribacillus iranensis TaxID=930128 RepID=A0A1I1ZNP1_9BACI|nr:helix-turn-helix domain-containing protein [Alteribacillus iranensis]SFE33265.1 Uncharacterized protein YpbB [Alteribacillus iranensis]
MHDLSFRHFVLLNLLRRLHGERTTNSMFHILTGKKSSQTIQDTKWYKLHSYFQAFPDWKGKHFHKDMSLLRECGLYKEEDGRALLTEKGKEQAEQFLIPVHGSSFFNGWKYADASIPFWRRLALFSQSLSHALYEHKTFLPVSHDLATQMWVKQFWPKTKASKIDMASSIHNELFHLLHELPEEDAHIFVSRLSGYELNGYTFQQIAEHIHAMDADEVFYRFQSVLHYLLDHRSRSPILSIFSEGLVKDVTLTSTAAKTYAHLKQGRTLQDIASVRQLKNSTIEDHVVEIASEDTDFPIHHYVPQEVQTEILRVAKQTGTYRLKIIKEQMTQPIDYFSIRLTLAWHGGHHEQNT